MGKYWNKRRQVRERLWIPVVVPDKLPRELDWSQVKQLMKKWCQDNLHGKFYTNLHTETWWFEKNEDAVVFALRWA